MTSASSPLYARSQSEELEAASGGRLIGVSVVWGHDVTIVSAGTLVSFSGVFLTEHFVLHPEVATHL